MLASAGIGATESGLEYGESILRPSLNVTQLLYGGAGAQRNAIDAEATAGFDLRLVPGMTVAGARAAIEAHVKKQGYALIDAPPTADERVQHAKLARLDWGDDGYPAAMSQPENPGVARVIAVMREATDGEVRVVPLMGGSLPIAPIGRGACHAVRDRAHRQRRQQPARAEREPADGGVPARHRPLRRAARQRRPRLVIDKGTLTFS